MEKAEAKGVSPGIMKVDYSLRQGALEIGGVAVDLPSSVTQLVELRESIVVLVRDAEHLPRRNVFCYDQAGRRLWTIEKSGFRGAFDPYMRLWTEGGQLIAESWQGIAHLVDLENGSVAVCGFSK